MTSAYVSNISSVQKVEPINDCYARQQEKVQFPVDLLEILFFCRSERWCKFIAAVAARVPVDVHSFLGFLTLLLVGHIVEVLGSAHRLTDRLTDKKQWGDQEEAENFDRSG